MDYLSVCAIVKDEDGYLPEWVMHHRLVGVTRFYIYDNGSKVPVAQAVKPFDHGDITVINFPGHAMQTKAYMDAMARAAGKSFWLAVIDLDEFLIPVVDYDIAGLLKNYEEHPALCVNWQMFGSCGHKVRPKGLQFNAYLKKNPENSPVNTHVKSIVRPELVVRPINPHSFVYAGGRKAVNEQGVPVEGAFSSPVSASKIKLNHYFTRSEAEYVFKISKGDVNGAGSKDMTLFHVTDRESTEYDASACRFSSHLKAAFYNDRIEIP